MIGSVETVIHFVWDEEGNVAAHVDAHEAADELDAISSGRFRRVLAVRMTLASAVSSEIKLDVPEDGEGPSVRKA